MTEVYDTELVDAGGRLAVEIPRTWEGASEGRVRVVLDEVCVLIPPWIADATGELIVLRFIEAIIKAGLITPGDVQKALEHVI